MPATDVNGGASIKNRNLFSPLILLDPLVGDSSGTYLLYLRANTRFLLLLVLYHNIFLSPPLFPTSH